MLSFQKTGCWGCASETILWDTKSTLAFFLSGKSIISYLISENCLKETDRKLLYSTPIK